MTPVLLETNERLSIDPGVSVEAAQLTRQFEDATAYSLSESIARPRANAISDLLQAYAKASNPDWDGEGANAMSPVAVQYAAAFLSALPTNLPMPDISADPDGDAYLEWDRGRHEVMTVTISADGSLHYACLSGGSRFHGAEIFKDRVPRLILEGIARVAGRRQG